VRELARALPVNQNTVIRAYEHLEHEGLITRRHGDGTFVAEGGSVLKTADRRRVLREILGQAALKARLFDVAPAELHRLLDEQIGSLPQDKD
jgi:GntR family transcriptional regulator